MRPIGPGNNPFFEQAGHSPACLQMGRVDRHLSGFATTFRECHEKASEHAPLEALESIKRHDHLPAIPISHSFMVDRLKTCSRHEEPFALLEAVVVHHDVDMGAERLACSTPT